MDMRGRRQIRAAGHQSHPLDRIIDRNRQVVARWHIFAGEYNVAERSRICQLPARPLPFLLDPVERTGQSERASEVKPQRIIAPGALLLSALPRAEAAARPRIGQFGWRMRRTAGSRDLFLDLTACAEARVEDAHRLQPIKRISVVVEMLGLLTHRAVPAQPEPGKIIEDRRSIFVAAASLIDVLKPEQKPPPGAARCTPSFERRTDVTEMQVTRRARRKPRHGRFGRHPGFRCG
jgi:hypothetical protein